MRGVISPLPQYVFMAWCLVKHRGNFTIYGHHSAGQNIRVANKSLENTGKLCLGTTLKFQSYIRDHFRLNSGNTCYQSVPVYLLTYLLTYPLHGAGYYLRS